MVEVNRAWQIFLLYGKNSNVERLLFLLIIPLVIVGVIGSVYYFFYYYSQQQSINYYSRQLSYMGYYGGYGNMMGGGMMGTGGGEIYYMMGYHNGYAVGYEQRLGVSQAISVMNNTPSYVKVFPNNDTLVLNSTHIVLYVLTMGHVRAINLTGYNPPSSAHATDNVFVIYGLITPTVVIPQGATVQFTVINLDSGDYHNIAITPLSPPYPYYAMMYVKMDVLGMSPFLPNADYTSGQAYEFTFTTMFSQSGTYYYLCEYPRHAEMGMYGQIIVS